jgi:DNA-directed RNA polymerase specialized sigma24 family protein
MKAACKTRPAPPRARWGTMFDFSNTRWSQVRRLGSRSSLDVAEERAWEASWEHLVVKYRPAFLFTARDCLRRAGGSVATPDQAEDVVQGFMAACLDKGWLQRAAPEYGRFRAFAFTLVRRYTFKYVEAARAQKRAPDGKTVQFDETDVAGPSEASTSPESIQSWMACLLAACTARVRARSENNAKVLELIVRDSGSSNTDMAEILGWPPGQVALARHRGIKMLRQELRTEMRETVRSARDYEDELELLRPYLAEELTPS